MHYKNWKRNNKIFLIEGEDQFSYDDLYQAIEVSKHALKNTLTTTNSYILESTNSFQSYVKFLALLKNGNQVILCPSAQFADEVYLQKISTEAGELFNRLEKNKIFSKLEIQNNEEESEDSWQSARFIVRTSGSSGKKFKLVLHDLNRFIKKYQKIGPHFIKTFAFSPAESIAGIETLLEVLTHELTLISGTDNLTPTVVAELIRKHNVDYFQTTPTYMNLMILSGQVSSKKIGCLKKVAYGSEPSQHYVVKYFKDNIPGIELVHTYGMSEIGIQKTITDQADATRFYLDKEFNNYKIVDDTLEVKSLTKMLRYLNDDETQSSSGAEWFHTFDKVKVEDQYLKVLGRHDDLINVAGRKFFPSELENLIRNMPEVKDATVTSESNDMIGTIIIATIVINPQIEEMDFRASFKAYCQEKVLNYMHPHKIRIKTELELAPRLKKMRKT